MICIYESETIEQTIKKLVPVITNNIRGKKCFGLAVAGGNTPRPLYEALAKQDLEWSNISITLTDERWVPVNDMDSNENMIRQCLLSKLNPAPMFVPLKSEHETAQQAQQTCQALLNEKIGSLDIVILGMGDDGHFASVFPAAKNVTALLDINSNVACLAVSPEGKQARMSLTLSYILSAKNIFLLITGEYKRRIIKEVMQGMSNANAYPIYHLLNQNKCPVDIYWNP